MERSNDNIFLRIEGEGNPVMLVHGFGEDGTVWEKQIDHLKTNFRLIIPDLPGSGKTTVDNKGWKMEDYADFLKDILGKESISSCTMIGHSMGGYITLAFAERFPGLLNGFGLFHSTASADSEEKKDTRRKGIEFINQHGAFEFLKTSIPNLFSHITKEKHPQLVQTLIDSASNFSDNALVSYYEAMMQRPERKKVLENVKIPVLFIAGEHDLAVPIKDVMGQTHLPQKSYIHILRQSGHMGMWEEAGKSNQILEEFLINI